MLNRGGLAGYQQSQFVSGFIHHWHHICAVQQIQDLYEAATTDILTYQTSQRKNIRSLINQRLKVLGRRIGVSLDLDELDRNKMRNREDKYEAFLRRHYNLSKQEAAKLLDQGMKAESQPYGLGRFRRR